MYSAKFKVRILNECDYDFQEARNNFDTLAKRGKSYMKLQIILLSFVWVIKS